MNTMRKSHSKLYRGRCLDTSGCLALSCHETATLWPGVFPVENNYEDVFSAEQFAECSGHVLLLPCGSLMWCPGAARDDRFDNVRCFIAGSDTKRWRDIPQA